MLLLSESSVTSLSESMELSEERLPSEMRLTSLFKEVAYERSRVVEERLSSW